MTELRIPTDKPRGISLREFNNRIKSLLNDPSIRNCWVIAETSDVRVNRHCYMELLEKDDKGDTVAKTRAVIWGSTYQHLNFRFRDVTGQNLASGMKVLVNISVNYHEQYGITLVINDIDPQYTIGDMARLRMEILDRLRTEGIIDLNRSMEMPQVPQRVAVISAAGAAGYGDFMKQLHENTHGLQFYTVLFEATMQGAQTVPTVIAALERIAAREDMFDCVAIIRGGGSTSDLNSFDNYELAANVAQFPLPIITGIGHDRDVTVLDFIVAKPVKTPTAAAQYLITQGVNALAYLDELSMTISKTVGDALARASEQLTYYSSVIPLAANKLIETGQLRLGNLMQTIPLCVNKRLERERLALTHLQDNLSLAVPQLIERERVKLSHIEGLVEVLSPRNTLKRGYTLTMSKGKIITDPAQLKAGDNITTHFNSGSVRSVVE